MTCRPEPVDAGRVAGVSHVRHTRPEAAFQGGKRMEDAPEAVFGLVLA